MMEERRVGLVTGSATGIGRSAALALARSGYDVAINYSRSDAAARETARDAEAAGARALLCKCDVSDDRSVRGMIDAIQRAYGRLDVLINNAGITIETPPSDLDGLSVEDWDRVFAVNVRGLFLVTRAAVPLLRQASDPCIVNTASIVGLRPGLQPLPYAASKAAVVNLTKTLATALGPKIRVNAVAPGWIAGEWMAKTLGADYERLMERRARFTPLRRVATPDDVADTMLTLIGTNRFVTGEIIVVDGGYSSST
jgi:3-oxoacyl-[acyl-carrier protein] reductase